MPLLILNKGDVERLLSMPKCIELMEDALASLARGQVILPLRPVFRIPDTGNFFGVMPAYSASLKAIGAKLISVFPGNHGTALDSHQGAVALFDGTTGSVVSVMDAASITAIRTAAVSGVATKLLARQDATTVAILGSGVQGHTHIDAMMAARPFKRVIVWSRDASKAHALVEWASKRHSVACEVAGDAAAAVGNADVVCTVTASREPVLMGHWLKDGAHVNAVGASVATSRELDTLAVVRSRVFVDRRESAANEAGELIIPMKEGAFKMTDIVAELGELLIGSAVGRRDDREITLFKSLGIAVEDLACAHWLYERASADKIGVTVEF
ncbi:MAG TPA: ornithine cyclodeaminase family protein [Gemmatimonadaceae bacterium]